MVKTNKDYFKLTNTAYKNKKVGDKIKAPEIEEYQVITVLNNPDRNGAEGIAVVPIIKGQTDYSQVTISYKGINLFDFDGDFSADVQQIVMGNKNKINYETIPGTTIRVPIAGKSQFDTAYAFAQQLKADPQFKNATFDYTGHSLGGGLATYVAAEFGECATVFSAPNIYRLLSAKAQAWVTSGQVHEIITNYTHMNDSVGNFDQFGAPLVGKRIYTKSNKELESFIMKLLTLGGHPTQTFVDMFTSDGSLQLLFAPALLRATAEEYDQLKYTASQMKKTIEQYEWNEAEAVMVLQKHIQSEANGAYSELEDHKIQDIIKAAAAYSADDLYYAHNPEVVAELKEKLQKIASDLGEFAYKLRMAAVKAEATDEEIATSF